MTLSEIFFLIGIIMRKDNYEYSGGYDEYINCCNDVDGNEFFFKILYHMPDASLHLASFVIFVDTEVES